MARGIIKHLKRIYAPKHWMLDKLRPGNRMGFVKRPKRSKVPI